jgi:hypothetical protein
VGLSTKLWNAVCVIVSKVLTNVYFIFNVRPNM